MNLKAFILLGFTIFLTMTGYGIVLPSLPYLAERAGLSSFQMGTLITAWALSQFLSTPLWGRAIDRFGRKPILLFGLFGFGIAFYLLVFGNSYPQLFFARLIGAFLSSGTMPAAFAIVADSTDPERRNTAMARMGALAGMGFLCGPALGGIFSPLGVTAPFLVAGSLAWITLPMAWIWLKEPEVPPESRQEHSVFRSMVLALKPGYRELYAVVFAFSVAASSLFGMLGYFMIERFDASSVATSAAFSIEAGTSVVVQFLVMDFLYRRFSNLRIAQAGFILGALGYLLIALSGNIWLVYAGCALLGVAMSMVGPTIVAMLSLRDELGQGMTMGIQQSMDSLGRIVGPLIGGWLFAIIPAGPFLASTLVCLLLLLIPLEARKQRGSGLPLEQTQAVSEQR